MKKVKLLITALLLTFAQFASAGDFTVGNKTFLLNGEPFVVKAAEVHYPRIPRPYWEHRIKMCKALGMNTLCIYVFWNIHEQREGQFDFTDNNDVAEFCRLAQKNGMYVIVRPGPYVCAEWEMGGLPWWLLKKKDIRLRERDPYFLERVKIFEQKVGEQLAPLTIQNGGPIIMVQVENEYGSYGEDKPYISEIRDCLRGIYGDKLTLFQCDWSSNFEKNGLDDLVWTMNFGTGANIDHEFARLKQLRPNAPLMCSEFWSGWFDKWGANHETRPAKDMVDGMDEMLSKNISFSLYMTHGGTSFGHWAGANSPGFAPDVTSYDYDAPINEYGGTTEKFFQLRKMMQKYSKTPLPAIPVRPANMINIPAFEMKEHADILLGADSLVMNSPLRTMEELNQGWGSMVYITSLPEIDTPSVLTLNDGHDFAQVFIDSTYIGKIDRVRNEKSLLLPAVKKGQELKILIEAMGRINFGRAIKDYKGITESVTLSTDKDGHELIWNLKRWDIFTIPDSYAAAKKALDTAKRDSLTKMVFKGSGYYRGYFNLKRVGDTFLNMENWGKGQVYVNGHAIGRFWSIGPQQTLYVPGCWLKKGKNEVVVLDVVGPSAKAFYFTKDQKRLSPWLFAQNKPELDKLNVEKSRTHNDPSNQPDLNSATPAHVGQLAAGNGWQMVRFDAPKAGRYLAIQALSTHEGKDVVSVAELYAVNADGARLSREPWTVKYADSEETKRGNNTAEKSFDLQESTYWRTERGAALPHLMVIDLGSEQTITGFDYLPRMEEGAPGSIKDYKIFVY
ncbi:beta-galactosidase [Xylanibacter ruminicola]|uniref:Beta-galactosidase n=1 Tax=Xylanibacter ruminicola TaxID=839 RepID=A0A1M7LIT9_XYLRU|nr:beta-galactosidase [Xylanibacter ruminicola]SHM78069.1 beta-galactosidase [Xylanibacter ruminicola]